MRNSRKPNRALAADTISPSPPESVSKKWYRYGEATPHRRGFFSGTVNVNSLTPGFSVRCGRTVSPAMEPASCFIAETIRPVGETVTGCVPGFTTRQSTETDDEARSGVTVSRSARNCGSSESVTSCQMPPLILWIAHCEP